MKAAAAAILFAVASHAVMDLTDSTFSDIVENSGKNVFVKFFAPWCGHCKRMKPDWDKLGEAYEASSSVIIADVDCTANQKTCTDNDVGGYPTVKYYTAETGPSGAKYESGRTYKSLDKFVKDTLEAKCTVDSPEEGCSDKEKSFIEKMKTKDQGYIQGQIERLTKMKGNKMKPSLKTWIVQRLNIFSQLVEEGKDEL
ncbi:hypothetical protein AAMO2058_001391700 [Amorphochlora amoebiformis]|eukprot:1226082-Amorphochlora_amoeboformis.AAC.1